tara:strand:- start:3196 stop:3999 length:804 start_codon:yes stop_codon:yes gene_type:complete
MYIPPEYDSNKSIQENQELHEKNIAKSLNVKPNSKILEVGCGCGRISNFISKETNSYVYGININKKHIEDAINFSKKEKNDKTFFKYGDFNEPIEFEDNFFDAIYVVQPLTYCNNLDNLFKEFRRVLKPNGKIVLGDYVLLDNFDKNNEKDLERGLNVRGITAGGGLWHSKYWEKAAEDAGFKIIESTCGDKYDHHYAPELPVLKDISDYFWNWRDWMRTLTQWKILPKNLKIIFDRVTKGGKDLIELMEEAKITTDYIFVFEKPKD